MDDLMQDRLMGWLEENSTTEKAPTADDNEARKSLPPKAPAKPSRRTPRTDQGPD